MRDLRVGLAGYGFGGRVFHAPLIRAVEGLELAAVYSPSEETRGRAHEELGVPCFATFDELITADLDVVVISTPHDTHADLSIRALRAGRHVVVDKVMCLTLEEADAMIAEAAQAERILSVYQNRRWDGDYLTLRAILEEKRIGDLVRLEARWLRAGGLSRRAAWRLDRSRGGGMWLDLGAHMVDQVLQLLGTPAWVRCSQAFTEAGLSVPTHTFAELGYETGVLVLIETGVLLPFDRPRWVAVGSEGAWEQNGMDPQEELLKKGLVGWPADASVPEGRLGRTGAEGPVIESTPMVPGDWGAFYRNIRDALWGTAALAVRPEECRETLRILLAAEESARLGRTVTL